MEFKFISKILFAALTIASAATNADIYTPQETFLNRYEPLPADAATFGTNYTQDIITSVAAYGPTESPAALTLARWKLLNGFGTQPTFHVQYYNSADLGLGRDMTCVDQSNFETAKRGANAMACYVSNFGAIGAGPEAAYKALNAPNDANTIPFATVAMEFRPSAADNKARFFVFGSGTTKLDESGKLVIANGQTNIVLDSGTGHSQPGVCMNCHGGVFTTPTSGKVKNVHFLAFDVSSLEFETPEKRNAAVPVLKQLNQLIRNAEITAYGTDADTTNDRISAYINSEYGNAVTDGATTPLIKNNMLDTFVDPLFAGNANDILLYKTVTRNYCRGCHLAVSIGGTTGNLTPALVKGKVCNRTLDMPHAEVTAKNLQRHMDAISETMQKITGQTTCYNQPYLEDFQDSANESDTITTLSNVSLATSAAPQNLFFKPFQTKRVLKLNSGSRMGTVTIQPPSVSGATIKTIKKIEYLAYSQSQDEFTFAGFYDLTGQVIPEPFPEITAIPNSPFSKYTYDLSTFQVAKAIVILDRSEPGYSPFSPRFANSVEIDDLSVTLSQPFVPAGRSATTTTAVTTDFETGTFTTAVVPHSGLISIARSLSSPSILCSSRIDNKGFVFGNALKVGRDGGRFSLHTNPINCPDEELTAVFRFKSGTSGQTRNFSFDFSLDKDAGVATVEGFVNGSIVDLAAEQGTLKESGGKYFGRISDTVPLGQEFLYINYIPLIASGINAQTPIKGLAIDNIVTWDQF